MRRTLGTTEGSFLIVIKAGVCITRILDIKRITDIYSIEPDRTVNIDGPDSVAILILENLQFQLRFLQKTKQPTT